MIPQSGADDRVIEDSTHRGNLAVRSERRRGRLKLCLADGPTGPREFELRVSPLSVGRSPHADLVIDDPSISKIHFELRLTANGVELRDSDSTNGCWLHGCRVFHARLDVGDAFRAGERQFVILEVDDIDVVASVTSRCGHLQGQSVVMRELFARIDTLSASPLDVLLLGETGTGKELTARTLHELSLRRAQPFVALDCGAISPSLAEATLFGFRRGSFTGADRDQPGVFEEASSGTIFLDEIGELLPELQVKLLRVLEQREVRRIGEPGKVRALDVRVIAATHRDLRREVAQGRFREDLFYRLARASLTMPPLRERGEDIVALAESFIARIQQEFGLDVRLGPAAHQALCRHAWPGNVRELKNSIEQAAHIKRTGEIMPADLRLGSLVLPAHGHAELIDPSKTYREVHAAVDRVLLARVLELSNGNLSETARRLGLSRDTLRTKLQATKIESDDEGES